MEQCCGGQAVSRATVERTAKADGYPRHTAEARITEKDGIKR
jgi:hypothetical protein